MNRKYFILSLFFCFYSFLLFGQKGYNIEVSLENYDQELLMLGYHYGEKQYIKDSVKIDANGKFVFKGEEDLDPGVYLVVMPPNNQYFQLLINKGEQHFSVATDAKAPNAKMKLEGTPDNQLFYDYMSYLGKKRPEVEALKKELSAATDAGKAPIQKKIDAINQAVQAQQDKIFNEHGKTLTAALMKSSIEPKMPEFKGSEKEIQLQRYHYYKDHYFDNINLADERLVRSPVLFQKIDYYINKLTVQAPDSIQKSVDYILEATKPAPETFKYYLVHFLNSYAQSKIVGMDAVYVHLAEKYYKTGQAPWTEAEQLKKILDNAQTLKPILIGKTAPDLKMFEIDIEGTIKAKDAENEYQRWKAKRSIRLHEIDAAYTVLFIWDPDCGHCKKSMPKMLEFYDNFKDKGVEVFAVCTKTYEEMPACAATIKEKGMIKWINAIDPFIKSKYKQLYDVRSTPQIFILDDKKEIISKKIGAEQLSDVMNRIIEFKKKEEKGEKSK
jgi:thiol-disulfide isomerase/thioredoxin